MFVRLNDYDSSRPCTNTAHIRIRAHVIATVTNVCTRDPAGTRYHCDVTVCVVAENAHVVDAAPNAVVFKKICIVHAN
jgi:hypothetical protein